VHRSAGKHAVQPWHLNRSRPEGVQTAEQAERARPEARGCAPAAAPCRFHTAGWWLQRPREGKESGCGVPGNRATGAQRQPACRTQRRTSICSHRNDMGRKSSPASMGVSVADLGLNCLACNSGAGPSRLPPSSSAAAAAAAAGAAGLTPDAAAAAAAAPRCGAGVSATAAAAASSVSCMDSRPSWGRRVNSGASQRLRESGRSNLNNNESHGRRTGQAVPPSIACRNAPPALCIWVSPVCASKSSQPHLQAKSSKMASLKAPSAGRDAFHSRHTSAGVSTCTMQYRVAACRVSGSLERSDQSDEQWHWHASCSAACRHRSSRDALSICRTRGSN